MKLFFLKIITAKEKMLGRFYDFDKKLLWTEKISEAKKEIEKQIKSKIITTRSHNTCLWIPETFDYLEKLKIKSDSSIYSELSINGKKRVYGKKTISPNNISLPFKPLNKDLIEIPVTHFECYSIKEIKNSIKELIKLNCCIVGLYHNNVNVIGLTEFLKNCDNKKIWKTTIKELTDNIEKRINSTTKIILC